MVLKAESMKYLPAPNGDYLFISTFGTNKDWKLKIKTYIQIMEK